ncbi:MAG: ferritin-like domain-containing protein [Myxococcota bacterium]
MPLAELRRRLPAGLAGAAVGGCGNEREPFVAPETEGIDPAAPWSTNTGTDTAPGSDRDDDGNDDGNDDGHGAKIDVGDPTPACPRQPADEPRLTCPARLDPGEYPLFYCTEVPETGMCIADGSVSSGRLLEPPDVKTVCLPPPMSQWGCSTALEHVMCGPLPEYADRCCYWFSARDQQCPGRPFVVAGRSRTADTRARADWHRDGGDVLSAPADMREIIATGWLQHAAFEHASVASFSRFVLQLLHCGAPADLVADASRALHDEVEHARAFFGFASRYRGHPVGPGRLAIEGGLDACTVEHAVLSAVREGCIAETVSAWHVRVAARHAKSATMAHTLTEIADEEFEHAMLAWRFVAWAIARASPTVVQRIADTFDDATAAVPRGPEFPLGVDENTLLAHGLLPPRVHALEARRALVELVAPAAVMLLPARPRAASAIGLTT